MHSYDRNVLKKIVGDSSYGTLMSSMRAGVFTCGRMSFLASNFLCYKKTDKTVCSSIHLINFCHTVNRFTPRILPGVLRLIMKEQYFFYSNINSYVENNRYIVMESDPVITRLVKEVLYFLGNKKTKTRVSLRLIHGATIVKSSENSSDQLIIQLCGKTRWSCENAVRGVPCETESDEGIKQPGHKALSKSNDFIFLPSGSRYYCSSESRLSLHLVFTFERQTMFEENLSTATSDLTEQPRDKSCLVCSGTCQHHVENEQSF